MMTIAQQIITVGAVVLGTVITRFSSFVIFPDGRETPKFIKYLGEFLPAAVFGMLVIYCYRNIDISSAGHGLPEIGAGVLTAVLHRWKKNMFLSIAAGTAAYMIIIRVCGLV
ncbi:MAG: branched-chain amino acid transporter permease [Huintestinicola sp.]